MVSRTIVELTPAEVAQLLGDALAQKYGLGEASIEFLAASGERVGFEVVRVQVEEPLEPRAAVNPIQARLEALNQSYQQHFGALDVEPVHEQPPGGGAGGQ